MSLLRRPARGGGEVSPAKTNLSLEFKLIMASMVLALLTIGLGGVAVYKVSEDAIKVDAQRNARLLASQLATIRGTGAEAVRPLHDLLESAKVETFGASWVMDRNGFLVAHMAPKFRNLVEAQTYIGDTVVELHAAEQPIQQLGEKNIMHRVKLQELIEKFDGGFGTYHFLGENKILAFRVMKDRGWLVAVDQPISTAFSELTRLKKVIVTTCIVISILVMAFSSFAVRMIIRPYYREQEKSNLRLEMMNQELEASRRKLEKAGDSLMRLYDLSIAMQYSGFLESHLPLVLGVAQERFEVDRILLMMPDAEGKFLRCAASVGNVFESEDKIFVPISLEGGGFARAYRSKRAVFWDGTEAVPEYLKFRPPYDKVRSLRSKAFAIFPLVAKEKVIGVLGVDNKMSHRPLSKENVEAMESFAYKMASLIDNTLHLQEIQKAAQEMENRDRLTGLYNLAFMKKLAEEHIEAATGKGVPFAMTMVHLTNFKEYNESNGYKRGDFVLQKTAEFLKSQEVMGVIPGRCFGANYIVLCPGKNEEQAKYLADLFLREFNQFSFYGEKRLGDGKMIAKVSTVEYVRESGKTFDEFFAELESV
ncbi:MAG: diguanylate cyclase [Deltaproteobacteria bacterium]|nr:diguanylate cyclase [Deltaproteobacteria bacterium]